MTNEKCVCDPLPGVIGKPCSKFIPSEEAFGDNADCLTCGHWEDCHVAS